MFKAYFWIHGDLIQFFYLLSPGFRNLITALRSVEAGGGQPPLAIDPWPLRQLPTLPEHFLSIDNVYYL